MAAVFAVTAIAAPHATTLRHTGTVVDAGSPSSEHGTVAFKAKRVRGELTKIKGFSIEGVKVACMSRLDGEITFEDTPPEGFAVAKLRGPDRRTSGKFKYKGRSQSPGGRRWSLEIHGTVTDAGRTATGTAEIAGSSAQNPCTTPIGGVTWTSQAGTP
jgi:hypothetical protein